MISDPLEQDEPLSALLGSGKDEMNFAEFPITLLTDKSPKGQKSIRFEDQIYDERRKKLITRKRIIEGSEEYGLPTATDDTVILALIQLTKIKSGFARRELEFSRLELIRLLGWNDEGKNYERIKRSLQRIANVTYNYDNAWWDNRQKAWTTKIFHILETVEINDSRTTNREGGLYPSRIVWNEVVFDSFQSGFLRNIDFQLCIRIQHPTALRLYRFLGKRFFVKTDWTFELKGLAYDQIGLGRNYEGGTQIIRKLQPAIDELVEHGFLEPLDDDQRYIKNGRVWSVRFVKKETPPPFSNPAFLDSPDQATEPAPEQLQGLIDRGVTPSTARDLLALHSAQVISAKIDVFDWLVKRKAKAVSGNPAGYLAESIRKDYSPPKGYRTPDEIALENEAKDEALRKQTQAKRRTAEEEARRLEADKASKNAAVAYLARLSPERRAEVESAAIAASGTDGRFFREIYIQKYVNELIRIEIEAKVL
jgi:hypothetical protein